MSSNRNSGADTTATLIAAFMDALTAGHRIDVDRVVTRMLQVRAPLGRQWRAIALASSRNGALFNARAAMDAYVAAEGGNSAARFERAAMLAGIGDLMQAADALRALSTTMPDPATRAHFLATLALGRGDMPQAREQFAAAIDARPESGASWLGWTDAQRGTPASDWAPQVVAAAGAMPATGPDRAAFLFALGAAQDALSDHDAAFAAFDAGAGIIRRLRKYDAAADRAAVHQALDGRFEAAAAGRVPSSRAIFVFGPPRSGTTLVEQILASHSAVSDGGEVGLFDLVVERVGGLSPAHMARCEATIGRDALAEDYLRLVSERFGPTGRIVDKTLTSTRFAGLIAHLLPDAPMVWVRRSPLDTAWSCFRTFFTRGVAWSWNQRDLATHLRLEDMLLDAWQDHLGDRLLVLDYRSLVTDPVRQIERLLAHCGLTSEPAVFEPHKTKRAVSTASVTQVRQPINTRAIGAAEPYRRHLLPFIDAYSAAGGTID